jgi:hypothetical protein
LARIDLAQMNRFVIEKSEPVADNPLRQSRVIGSFPAHQLTWALAIE